MKIYLLIAEDSTNMCPVYTAFTTKEKARECFTKEMEDYWPKEEWGDDGTAEQCIEQMDYDDGSNYLYVKELDADSGNWV